MNGIIIAFALLGTIAGNTQVKEVTLQDPFPAEEVLLEGKEEI